MGKVVLEITYSRRRILYTEPMGNLRAVEALSLHLARKKRHPEQVLVFDDDEHTAISAACFAIAEQEGDVFEFAYGPRLASGRRRYRVRLAPLPHVRQCWPVVGEFPLLKQAQMAKHERPEARGIVRASDSLLDVLDTELAEEKRTALQCRTIRLRPIRPASWFDRLLAWLLGDSELPKSSV